MKYPIIAITNEQKLAVDKFNADEKIKFEEINCPNCNYLKMTDTDLINKQFFVITVD